jgi:hypothetical protein
MKNSPIKYKIVFLIILGLMQSCAQQVPPDGGIKDEIPPKVIGSKPLNQSINFKSEKIEIYFDEFIQIKEPKNIIISPKLTQKPIIQANGKKIEIQFLKNSLDSAKTYTINIGNAVADIHEAKSIESYNYILSTGTWIDSNQINGLIIDSETYLPQKNITVALSKMPENRDSNFYKKNISYITKSNDKGEFELKNIPSDNFEILAFKDDNYNNQIDKSELIGTYYESQSNTQQNKNIRIKIHKQPDYQTDKLIDTIYNKIGIIKFIIYDVQNTKLRLLNTNTTSHQKFIKGNENYDTIQFYINNLKDSILPTFLIINEKNTDTLKINGNRIKSKNQEDQNVKIITPEKPTDSLIIQFKLPITEFNSDLIKLMEDTILLRKQEWEKIDEFNYYLKTTLKPGLTYNLEVRDSSTKSYNNKYNKVLNIRFSLPLEEEFGIINLINSLIENNKILVQLKDNEKIIYSEKLTKTIHKIKYIKPGTYTLRLIKDTNDNHKWDNGNIILKQQPESIKILNNQLKIKANWDTEINLSDSEINFD